MLLPQWGLTSKLQRLFFYETLVLNSADSFQNPPTAAIPEPKEANWNNSTIIKDNIIEEIKKLKQQPGGDILIPGSASLVHPLMKTDLIDEYQFLVQPIIMGSGKRFFKDGMVTTRLKLVKTTTLSLGIMLLCYQPVKN